jgi:uncharacterized protein (DUF4415 family)
MASETPVIFDEDNPEWTEADFARARPAAEVLPAAFMGAAAGSGRSPAGAVSVGARQRVTLSLDRDVLEAFRATGPGWQNRINEVLRKAQQLPGSP